MANAQMKFRRCDIREADTLRLTLRQLSETAKKGLKVERTSNTRRQQDVRTGAAKKAYGCNSVRGQVHMPGNLFRFVIKQVPSCCSLGLPGTIVL